MADLPHHFYALWQEDAVRDRLFRHLSNTDLAALRLASSACCNIVTKKLFLRTHVTFSANTFTKPSRVQALARIGHHIEHLTFYMPHSDATFLPPLIHPETGEEINFLYTPHTSMASVLTRPKYANAELGDILTLQYPPLFHAATNVPSFIIALRHLPNMRHLTIKCPGQDPRERYRRDIVDYALISLRIAVERAPMAKLSKLSLVSLHPAAFNYIRHTPGFGAVPSAGKRWSQIKKLYMSVESWDFCGSHPGLDQLKVIDDYIRFFAPELDKFTFTWVGDYKGPCPLSLAEDSLFRPPRSSQKLFNEVTSPNSPLPSPPGKKSIVFPKLRYMQVRNATMTSPQMAELVSSHRATVKEFDFESVVLMNGGSWDDALAPLMGSPSDRSEVWSRSSSMSDDSGSTSGGSSLQTASSFEDLQGPSAAVAAAARALGSELGIELLDDEEYDDLASDIAAAREASKGFSTKLTKKKVHKRRRRKHRSDDEKEGGSSERHHQHRGRSNSDSRVHYRGRSRDRKETKSHHSKRHRSHKRTKSNEELRTTNSASPVSSSPLSMNPVARLFTRTPTPRLPTPRQPTPRLPTPPPAHVISKPMPNMDPQPVLLQPTVYDPNAPPSNDPDDCITPVQRNLEKEEAHRLLAEDEGMRASALRRAKEAVLAKLSWEYGGRKSTPTNTNTNNTNTNSGSSNRPSSPGGTGSIGTSTSSAYTSPSTSTNNSPYTSPSTTPNTSPPPAPRPEVVPAAPATEMTRELLSPAVYGNCGASSAAMNMTMGLREALFGKSTISVLTDHRGLESQTALVPLMFSRS